ncbi:nitrogenase stabilizing/protective protein NifW [Methylocystis echinoides]|uniref:Nitrogenase-stabilizing/protective protein NifW n=1 Tax=Methylocystis echinoides TaxID=29468 RepID=A0A9W6GWE2_9HYPH|nr:nitrogenase stabilizing/protective protein NifW [Methylocystis echinoides]GLI94105.1 nitrogenase-stabilizing/protective protein NifW [Methylocystis echinoides]
MSVFDELRKLSSAEDFFETLGVDYDPAVVRVARLHILRRMGEYLAKNELDGATDDEARAACQETLSRAYEDFVASSPIAERVFKVHKDAVKPKAEPAKPFVPLTTLTGNPG